MLIFFVFFFKPYSHPAVLMNRWKCKRCYAISLKGMLFNATKPLNNGISYFPTSAISLGGGH